MYELKNTLVAVRARGLFQAQSRVPPLVYVMLLFFFMLSRAQS